MKIRLTRFALPALLALIGISDRAIALDDPNRITLPTAASIVGVAPFFSDVRVFNTSYDSTISLEATYRCFIGSCPAVDRGLQIVVGPRETKSYNDMIGVAFSAPNSAGGVEFEVTAGGSAIDIGVTSRLYSTSPEPTVGMFIPGLLTSAAQPITFLGQIANGGAGAGFRTNAGAFNPGDAAVSARFDVFNESGQLLGSQTKQIPAHKGIQINNVFGAIGRASESTSDAVIVVTATAEVFSFAAVIDNETTDPFLVIGAEDVPAPPGHEPPPAPTQTPTPQATPRPTATPTPRPQAQTITVNVGEGGLRFVDQTSGGNTTHVHVGDTVKWVWVGGSHSTTSGTCSGGCRADGLWDSGTGSGKTFSKQFTQAGTFPYFCIPHGAVMTGTVVVQ
ncbi:MAG TPA: plastocyanin/azurin family copper-binding protein [Thermoanaerobaculia bacterium]|jgi:plastocyanin